MTAITWVPNKLANARYLKAGVYNYARVGQHLLVPQIGMSFNTKTMTKFSNNGYEGNIFKLDLVISTNDSQITLRSNDYGMDALKQK